MPESYEYHIGLTAWALRGEWGWATPVSRSYEGLKRSMKPVKFCWPGGQAVPSNVSSQLSCGITSEISNLVGAQERKANLPRGYRRKPSEA